MARRPNYVTIPNIDALINRHREGESLTKIAGELHCDRCTLSARMRERGYVARTARGQRMPTPIPVSEMARAIKMYQQGYSLAAIGRKMDREPAVLFRAMKTLGVRLRKPGWAGKRQAVRVRLRSR